MSLISTKMHAKHLKIKVVLHFGVNKAGFLEKIKHSHSLFLPALLKYTVCPSPGLQYSGHMFLHIGSWQTLKWISSFLFILKSLLYSADTWNRKLAHYYHPECLNAKGNNLREREKDLNVLHSGKPISHTFICLFSCFSFTVMFHIHIYCMYVCPRDFSAFVNECNIYHYIQP